MILFCGIPSEPSLGLVIEQVRNLRIPYLVFNQRRFASFKIEFGLRDGMSVGRLLNHEKDYDLGRFTAVYSRLVDFRYLPEVENEPTDSLKVEYCRDLHDTLIRWSDIAPCRIVNRPGSMGSNYSKPYQAQLIRQHGFAVPETIVTNDPDRAQAFLCRQKRVIYKSVSNIRSIVQTFTEKDFKRLNLIRLCPVQFQQHVEGTNVRVHTINGQAIASAIQTSSIDYRYSPQTGTTERFIPMELPDKLARSCLALAQSLGLNFAGIDLIITPESEVYCLEVNPSPAFSYYEKSTGQPIARMVAAYLVGDE